MTALLGNVDLVELFWSQLKDSFALYKHESLIGFVALGLLFLMSIVLIWLWWKKRPLQYQRRRKGVRNPFGTKFAKLVSAWKYIPPFFLWLVVFIVLVSSSMVTLTTFVSGWGESLFLSCDDDEFGIILAKFGGADLSERLGPFGVRGLFAKEFDRLPVRAPHDNVRIRFSNQQFQRMEDADAWREAQNAKLLIWGYCERGSDSITVDVRYAGLPEFKLMPEHNLAVSATVFAHPFQKITVPVKTSGSLEDFRVWVSHATLTIYVMVYYEAGQFELARTSLEELNASVDMYPQDDDYQEFYCMLSTLLAEKTKDYRSAIRTAWQLDTLWCNRDNPPYAFLSAYQFLIGKCYLSLDDTAAAITAFDMAIEYDSTNVPAYRKKAMTQRQAGEFGKALQTALAGLSIDSGNSSLLRSAGVSAYQLGDFAKAIEYFAKLYEMNPTDTMRLNFRAISFMAAQAFDSCLSTLDALEQVTGTLGERQKVWQVLSEIRVGRLASASKRLNDYITVYPCFRFLYGFFAAKYDSLGDTVAANAYYESFFATDPDSISACLKHYDILGRDLFIREMAAVSRDKSSTH